MFPTAWISEAQDLLAADDSVLRIDETGTIRIGKSRITLDLIVERYESGATPEEIVATYDTLALADVYSAIGRYLRHRNASQRYLQRRNEYSEELQQRIQTERPQITREELLSRRHAQEQLHAPAGQ